MGCDVEGIGCVPVCLATRVRVLGGRGGGKVREGGEVRGAGGAAAHRPGDEDSIVQAVERSEEVCGRHGRHGCVNRCGGRRAAARGS